MINLIKFIILECNEIIKIKKPAKYLKIENIQKNYLNFLVDINEITKGEVNIKTFDLANLDKDIRQKIDEHFKGKIINLDIEEDKDSNDSYGELYDEVFRVEERVKRK